MVACYIGLNTKGGTVGVGRATKEAVVRGSICVFILNFFLTKVVVML